MALSKFAHYTDDHITRPGSLAYVGAITLPAQVIDGIGAVAEVALAFKAEKVVTIATEIGCFGAGTPIATSTGLRRIEDIKIGDLVLSYDLNTNSIVSEPVTALIRNAPQPTYEVATKSASGTTDFISVTAEHPWLMAPSHQWQGTKELHSGDLIQTAQGEKLSVISVKATGKIEQIFNFAVADTHTYLVGKDHAVVHNSCAILNQVMKHFAGQGWNAGKFQSVLGWCSKAEGAAARLGQIDATSVAAMQKLGLTNGMARALRAGYADAVFRSVGEGVAEVRVQVLDSILKNW